MVRGETNSCEPFIVTGHEKFAVEYLTKDMFMPKAMFYSANVSYGMYLNVLNFFRIRVPLDKTGFPLSQRSFSSTNREQAYVIAESCL